MGRSPCCDKVGLKKGPWTPEEDQKLLAYIEQHGHGSWRALPSKAGLQRCGKSCRLRWTNYLRPDIKRGKFSLQEEQTIIQLHALLGNRWSAIATHLPKRTDNEIKNYWNTHLKKRLAKMGIDPVTHKPKADALGTLDGHAAKTTANLSHMAQWESARLEAEARLVRESKLIRSVSTTTTSSTSTKAAAAAALNPSSSSSSTSTTTTTTSSSSSAAVLGVPTAPLLNCLDAGLIKYSWPQAPAAAWSTNILQSAGTTNTSATTTPPPGAPARGIATSATTSADHHHLESPTSTLSFSENMSSSSTLPLIPTTAATPQLGFKYDNNHNINTSNNIPTATIDLFIDINSELCKDVGEAAGEHKAILQLEADDDDDHHHQDQTESTDADQAATEEEEEEEEEEDKGGAAGTSQLLVNMGTPPLRLHDMILNFQPAEAPTWSPESSNKTGPAIFMEAGFADLLLQDNTSHDPHKYASSPDHRCRDGTGTGSVRINIGGVDHIDHDSGGANADGHDDEGMSYWTNILNLANSSPSNSPMF